MQLHFKQTGNSGSNILILHGLFGNSRNWQSIASYLSQHHQVYTLDLRNHGLSPHSSEMTYQDMAVDISDFITQHEISTVKMIGHSMGGKVAMYLALTKPQLISKLVIVDIAPVEYQHNFADIFNGLLHVPLDEIKTRKDADKFLALSIKDSGIRQFLLQNLHLENQSIGKQNSYWKFNLQVLKDSVQQITDFPFTLENSSEGNSKQYQYSAKTLFLSGQDSEYINDNNTEDIKHFFPGSKIVTVKGAGHWLHAEKPDVVKNILSAFLE
jgi:esterase